MSGIYIHIPFCKQACHYCDFHFSTNLRLREEMVDTICLELESRKNFLSSDPEIETVYFGGGTPSILSSVDLDKILGSIHKNFDTKIQELTLEANPDDLNPQKLLDWKAMGFNRLSIGIQSFDQKVLEFYNRAHNAQESLKAIDLAKSAGFDKLSIDLIYGFPHPDHSIWNRDLETALRLDPGHISSYALTVEPKTALGNWKEKGKFLEADEDFVAEQFETLMERCTDTGYIQYEISNFGKENHFSLHNSNYWKNKPYLGVGPGAHSYDGKLRGSNIANNPVYIKKLKSGLSPFEIENLEGLDICNEYILTSLRTIWGIDLSYVKSAFKVDLLELQGSVLKELDNQGLISVDREKIVLKKKGRFLADGIAASLFVA
ncbi:radical SAM family heme chaperone HemW [Arthrospiribacter ruber]|uniref:Heme chaperone HemW n=1 Tax=Arthrospiribacter ruber TaxID=2487934 RepID=A0A951MCA5_9BACT|nr:radical SAM family heme chaperone HemW [Arthrospiribacter ruber]MBW3467739.1 radical SAM family heme chaperone HemW [Arthrospiribacter ruber]